MDPELRDAIELNRAKTETLTAKVEVLYAGFASFKEDIREKHAQNRRDIHGLRDTMQTFVDKWHSMQISQAREKGYWLGVGGVCVALVEIGKLVLEHLWK